MTFLELIKDNITNLPIEQPENVDFRTTIRNLFEIFGEKINNLTNLSKTINGIEFNDSHFKKQNKILREGIIKTIDSYFEGNPHKAYTILNNTLNKSNIIGFLDKRQTLPAQSNLYRIRMKKGNYPLQSHQLFHIPFEKRGKVETQRYGISGLPSLYLSNSIYVAWEEMIRPSYDLIQVIRLVNNDALRLLDLSIDTYINNNKIKDNNLSDIEILYKIMIWPLIASCSIKVKNQKDTFKPEYIIPQLLLQWINKNEIDAIKYSSTHLDYSKHEGLFYNLVLPVKTFDNDIGYCPELVKLFKSTDVIPFELLQFIAARGNKFYGQESISMGVNKDINSIELIKGNSQPYSSTYFGITEHSLEFLELQQLDERLKPYMLKGNKRILINIELENKELFYKLFKAEQRYSGLKTSFHYNIVETEYFTFEIKNGSIRFLKDFKEFLKSNGIGYKQEKLPPTASNIT